uniref:PH domain-containing protein n=1 Tax=Spongospora subterranea TaxID=70186 RepID=A0A0H5R9N6_9EUKA|eukprot:CRZ10840.1 hypothetical protein [Spongospora subterranea]
MVMIVDGARPIGTPSFSLSSRHSISKTSLSMMGFLGKKNISLAQTTKSFGHLFDDRPPIVQIKEITLFEGVVHGFLPNLPIKLKLTDQHLHHKPGISYHLLELHAVKCDPLEPKGLLVQWLRPKSNTRSIGTKVKGEVLGSILNAQELILVERYNCLTIRDKETIFIILDYMSKFLWQTLCEESFIPSPEIYQTHVLVLKVNRKGQSQPRVLVLSTCWLYNVECHYGPISIRQAKWAIPVQAIVELQLGYRQESPMLTLLANEEILSSSMDTYHLFRSQDPPKSRQIFCFCTAVDLESFVTQLCYIFFTLNGKELHVNQSEKYSTQVRRLDLEIVSIVHGFLMKHRKNKTGAPHRRYVALSETGIISWSEDPNSFKMLSAQVVNCPEGEADKETLTFVVKTTSKTLQFVAETMEEYQLWVNALQTVARNAGPKATRRTNIV